MISNKVLKKAQEKITIETTYGALAKAYAILGKANGSSYGSRSLWQQLNREIFNRDYFGDDTVSDYLNKIPRESIINYDDYSDGYMELLFADKEDIKTKELRQRLDNIENEAKLLRQQLGLN